MLSGLYVRALWQNHGLCNHKENEYVPSLRQFMYNVSAYI